MTYCVVIMCLYMCKVCVNVLTDGVYSCELARKLAYINLANIKAVVECEGHLLSSGIMMRWCFCVLKNGLMLHLP